MALEAIGYVVFGVHQQVAWQADNPFVWATAGSCWKFGSDGLCDVYTDHSEVAIVEFPNVRAPMTGGRFSSVSVWVRADAFDKVRGNDT